MIGARRSLSVGLARASFVVCFVDVAVARSPTFVRSVVCEVRTHCFMNGTLGELLFVRPTNEHTCASLFFSVGATRATNRLRSNGQLGIRLDGVIGGFLATGERHGSVRAQCLWASSWVFAVCGQPAIMIFSELIPSDAGLRNSNKLS